MKILLADDDLDLLDVTSYALRREGFNVIAVADGMHALRSWQSDHPDVVILDATMPRMSGFEVCRQIRQSSQTPVIMLTALNNEDHVIQGFQIGADDYVTKPFSHRQLAARILAVWRRSAQGDSVQPVRELQVGNLYLDRESHEVRCGDQEVRLTPTEFRLLYILAANAGHVVNSYRLVDYAWQYDQGDPSLLKTHISHIRKKLGLPRGGVGDINVVPRVGYRFLPPKD